MNSRVEQKALPSASIPRIDIEDTVTNDIRLVLDMLMPTNDLGRLIRNYETFFAEHRAEIRLINQVINQRNDHNSETAEEKEAESTPEDVEQLNCRKLFWLSGNGSLLR